MPVFKEYAKYYDLIYEEKDYKEEANYVDRLIKYYKPDAKSLLDLGCGSGGHAFEFAQLGYDITGIDNSERMIELAKKRRSEFSINNVQETEFLIENICSYHLNKKFDVVTSLFHVMSYLTSDDELKNAISTVKLHLKQKGLFIFDFWYGPSVLHKKPKINTKYYENNGLSVKRQVIPKLIVDRNTVDVFINLSVNDINGNNIKNLNETHRMRYYFKDELETLLENNEFQLKEFNEWETGEVPGKNTWNVYMVAQLS